MKLMILKYKCSCGKKVEVVANKFLNDNKFIEKMFDSKKCSECVK